MSQVLGPPRAERIAGHASRRPSPRPGVYDLYWQFAANRHRAFERRAAMEPAPWSDDPILQEYKFCNVFRAADRVSQYLIRRVAYGPEQNNGDDRLFQVVAFRLFSRNETWDSVSRHLGHAPQIKDLISGAFSRALERTKLENGGLYTGAFILCATNAYDQSSKHLNHVELLRHMFVGERIGAKLTKATSLRNVYALFHEFPLLGDFMAYQLAIDVNYTELVNFDEDEFTQPGPGALRGIQKAFTDLGGMSPSEVILWMTERQEEEFTRLGLTFGGLWGRRLHAIDCQNLFCEFDKYCRVAVPELASNRTRIKSRFVPSAEPISYFFPPKWGLNEKIDLKSE